MRWLQLAAVFIIPVAAIALALTFRGTSTKSPISVLSQSGSYQAKVGKPLSVTAFVVVNRSKSNITVTRLRVLERVLGLHTIGALAYRGCPDCLADSAVPPVVTPPTQDTATPALLKVRNIVLKPGEQLTILLSVTVLREGRVHVPPLRIDVKSASGTNSVETLAGPSLCAGKNC
jgi:hypothetical protein